MYVSFHSIVLFISILRTIILTYVTITLDTDPRRLELTSLDTDPRRLELTSLDTDPRRLELTSLDRFTLHENCTIRPLKNAVSHYHVQKEHLVPLIYFAQHLKSSRLSVVAAVAVYPSSAASCVDGGFVAGSTAAFRSGRLLWFTSILSCILWMVVL